MGGANGNGGNGGKGSAPQSDTGAPLRLSEIYDGASIFIMGSTGFLGKVVLAMLLHNFPSIRRVYVMVRAGSGTTSEKRFHKDVVGSPVFDPLRERFGQQVLDGMLAEKVRVVGGDITHDNLGYSPEEAQAIADDIDIIVNSSGKVTFSPPLDQSLRTNVNGTKNVLAFAKRMKVPRLVHVSTCFVAGNRSGAIWENVPVESYFPRGEELEGASFSAEREILECDKLAVRVKEEAKDSVLGAELRLAARNRLREEGRDPDNERYQRLATARERKNWVRTRMTELGIERAERWGWPNIYCYAKSLAEQLVAAEEGIVRTIVRPAIVESAESFPFSGWNEGFTTSAPIIFLALKGQTVVPCSKKLILDVIPVDHVAGGLLLATAQCLVEQPPMVFQLASGDVNPLRMERMVTLLGLYKREYWREKDEGNTLLNQAVGRMEVQQRTFEEFETSSVPMLGKLARKTLKWLDKARPSWGGPTVADIIDRAKAKVERVEAVTEGVKDVFDLYEPFIGINHYTFRCDNVRAVQARVPAEERHLAPWSPEEIDWFKYMHEVHFPGLRKWVLPELEEDFAQEQGKYVYTYNHLVELFETSSKLHSTRVAMRMERDGHRDHYTFAEVHELATRVAGHLANAGVAPGDRVMLLSENRPEWAMSYFGVLKTGATCVPIDKESTAAEIVNLARAGSVKGLCVSEKQLEERPELEATLRDELSLPLWRFGDLFELQPREEEQRRTELLPARFQSDGIASLIYTSGTTGQPKGVMLTHKNFTFMLSELKHVFDVTPRDGMLSVLPLHHTLEFAAGLLMPLSGGAQVTYLDELSSDSISGALKQGKTTAIVGVPALWDLLYRRIKNNLADGPRWLDRLLNAMIRLNSWIQQKSPIDLGRLLFLVVHNRFGGRIRYLISGGSALGDNVKKLFHGLGMPIFEGYGLTESAPVLTVARPDDGLVLGSVGRPLPHVDVQILDPDAGGVGEVIARGNNVMVGYYENDEATGDTIRDGWLHTGDLGYMDEDDNLYIVGRSKDVIVDHAGKNIYPDELEDLYGDHPLIKELCVVGLPEPPAEQVAALVVPDYESDEELERAEVQQRVHDHLREISADLPFFKRIKTLHLWDRDLPRTATRKVKRREVIKELERLERLVRRTRDSSAGQSAHDASKEDWLIDIVASVCSKPRGGISMSTRLSELGFDSLMYTELAVAVDAAGGALRGGEDLTNVEDLRQLAELVERVPKSGALVRATDDEEHLRDDEDRVELPAFVSRVGRKLLDLSRRAAYRGLLDTRVTGRSYVPYHTNFIVAPNHCSHADIGLVKEALGDAADNLCALAASDYFFDSKAKRTFFENFTRVVPMDRGGSLRKSLRRAEELLRLGYSLLIFPEGTRSPDGELADFKASVGYLAMHARVPILPMHLEGTHDVLPKGARFISLKDREVTARIGELLTIEQMDALTEGLSRAEAYRAVAAAARRMVAALRDGERRPTIEALRESTNAGGDAAATAEQPQDHA